jgi:quercetin dioxygenase-like cupin family protein
MIVAVKPKHMFTYEGNAHNVFHVDKGEGIPKHGHMYTHATICHHGSIVIRKENKEVIANKESGAFNLKENEWHEIEALENNTVFENIFTKEFQGTY